MAYLTDEEIKEFAARLRDAALQPMGENIARYIFTPEVAEQIVRVLIDLIEAKRK